MRAGGVVCVDVRPVSALRYGFVEGAWLLADLADLPPTDQAVVVLAADPMSVVDAGHPVCWGGLAAWEAAGFTLREPEWKSPLPLLHPVAVAGEAGWIQDIAWGDAGFVYAVLLESGQRRDGLSEEDITSLGPRGSAGLGEQI